MDALEFMQKIEDNSIDLILCDLPYGMTACKWDTIIDLEKMWKEMLRISKEDCAMVFTASQPFTSKLIMSNPELFRYELIWLKTRPSNVFNAKKMFMKWHENILIFYKELPTFNPIMFQGKSYVKKHYLQEREKGIFGKTGEKEGHISANNGMFYPKTVIEVSNPNHNSLHPTQKPVELFEYLIKTYSNEGDLVMDCVVGSGTTAIACVNTKRNFICNDNNLEYVKIANERLTKLNSEGKFFSSQS